jgi:hypothetical protein
MNQFHLYNLFLNNLFDIYIDNHLMYLNKSHYFDMVYLNKMNHVIDKILHDKILDMNNYDNQVQYHNIFHHLNMVMIDMIEHVLHMYDLENHKDIDKQMLLLDLYMYHY